MSKTDKNAEFDAEWNSTGRAIVTPARGGNNDKFKPAVGEVYDRLAILREPSWEIPSKNPTWQPSVAVNIVNLENGHRMDWWFSSTSASGRNSIFRDRLSIMLETAKTAGHNYPIEFKFKIVERTSQHTGNTYKELQPMFVASGDDIEGDLGVDPRDNPNNDASIPSKVTTIPPSNTGNKATDEQWSSIKTLLREVLDDGYTVDDVVGLLTSKDLEVTKEHLSGSPDGTGLPRIGYGTMTKDLAIDVLSVLTIASTYASE